MLSKGFKEHLISVTADFRAFSWSMSSLYGLPDTMEDIQKLRNEARNVAYVYAKSVLPTMESYITSISSYFNYCQDLTMDKWWENIADITEKVKTHCKTCNDILILHSNLIGEMMKLADEARKALQVVEALAAEYKQQEMGLQAGADAQFGASVGLSFIPIFGSMATGVTKVGEKACARNAAFLKEKASIQAASIPVIRDTLAPALRRFADGLKSFSSVFEVIYQQLETLHGRLEKAITSENVSRLHYSISKQKVQRIMQSVNGISTSVSSICIDLEAIPTMYIDHGYTSKLMEQQIYMIK